MWPLSTPDVPKQFSALIGDRSLFAMTLDRLDGMRRLRGAIVVTGSRHLDLVKRETSSATVPSDVILIEPQGRNTAPAAVAAALVSDPADVLVILPSDHLIDDVDGFQSGVSVAADLAASGGIVTFGIEPDRPETGYGYIEKGAPTGSAYVVERFQEKPDEAEAERLVDDGRHLWNSGMFVVRADQLLEEARRLCPQVVTAVSQALPDRMSGEVELGEEFTSADAISFDYAIMEKTERALVVPLDVGWDDVGSYRSLLAVSEHDAAGNHTSGAVTIDDVRRSYVKSTSRPVVVAGLEDVVVVETEEGVLVVPMDRAQEVRDLQKRATAD